jgi:para-nitrobenzyl esterase
MKKILVLLTFFVSTITFNSFANSERPVVAVETGSLQGAIEHNMNVFKNIPYAAPPVGDLR